MKIRTCSRQDRQRRIGAAALEFALVVPLMLTLALGTVDLAQFFHSHYGVINAARTAAAHASMNSETTNWTAWNNQVRQVALDEMDQLIGFDPNLATVTVVRDFSGGPLPRLRVTVEYPFATVVPWFLQSSSFQIVHTAEFGAIR